jgi:predicted ATPase
MTKRGKYLLGLEIINKTNEYPFTIPSITNFKNCVLHDKVTYFIGDNGCGKSTLLEAIAISLRINAEGGNRNTRYSLLKTESTLCNHILVTKTGVVIPDAFFFRAETLFSLFIAAHNDEKDNPGYSWGVHGWSGLDKMSHGEGHLELIMNKMENGVYIFDEPESGLGIDKQFQFISEIDRLVKNGSQVIIATHSPVILSYPDSIIYRLSDNGYDIVTLEESKPFQMTKMFISHHKKIVKELTSD